MKKAITAVGLCLALVLWGQTPVSKGHNAPGSEAKVLVCHDSLACTYHKYMCTVLAHCSKVSEVTIPAAEKMKRTPCDVCYK